MALFPHTHVVGELGGTAQRWKIIGSALIFEPCHFRDRLHDARGGLTVFVNERNSFGALTTADGIFGP